MKKLYFLILMAVTAITATAQTVGEAFYIYRNDGGFNAFFRDEVDSIAYSHYDVDSVYYDENVTQLVYTADSLYRIPLAAIDSVSFVQPETIVNDDVFLLTAEHSPYIFNADTLQFSMLSSTPSNLRPKVGNIVVGTADCIAFSDGIIAMVESIEVTSDAYVYKCSMASVDDVFDQLLVYSQQMESDDSGTESRGFDMRRATLTGELWNWNWSRTLSGGGTTTTLNVGDRASVTVIARKTLTTPFYFQVQLQNALTSSIDFNAKSTVGYFEEKQIGNTISAGRITVPYTGGVLWFTPKLSLYGYFQEEGSVQLNYSGHFNRTDKVVFTYTQGQWSFNHAPSTSVGTDIAQLSMEGYAEVGLRPQIDFSLNGRKAGFGMSARVGLKEYINFVFDMTKLSDGGLYDAMRDSYCRTTIPWSLTVHASADIFSRYDSNSSDVGFATASYTFEPNNEPQWGEDRYIFPLFSDLSAQRQTDNTAQCSATVSRTPLLPVQVGFSLLDENKNILQTQYDARSYQAGSLFGSYSSGFSDLSADGKYIVRPSVKLLGMDVLASPSAELNMHFPVTLSDFKVTKSQYKQNGFTHEGVAYDYRFDVSVNATLDDDAENIADWGYIYLDPNGQEAKISLRQFGTTYTDTRWAYYRNGTPPFTCTLYGYVQYVGSDELVYGEPHDYPLEYGETTCPDANHPHWIDLGLPSGTKWACCNVGASTPEQYGNYYAWGETQPKSVSDWDTYQYYNGNLEYPDCYINIGSDIAGTQYDAATSNWGAPWRMPSRDQIKELVNTCSYTWSTQNGVKGGKFTGPNGGTIFLPAAGFRWFSDLGDARSLGAYWSSTLRESGPSCAYDLHFNSGYADWGNSYRVYGLSVRPVR